MRETFLFPAEEEEFDTLFGMAVERCGEVDSDSHDHSALLDPPRFQWQNTNSSVNWQRNLS